MKASELMLGDWVLDTRTKKTLRVNPFMAEMEVPEWEPIPITKELLEKNGFVRENLITSYNHYIGIDNRVSLNDDFYCMNSRNMWTVHIDSEYYCTIAHCELTYLHELQHLLRICKINFEFSV